MADYRVIDADSHVNEPADVWRTRVPAKLRDLAPRMVEVDGGKVGWSFEGGRRIHRVTSACAGIDETAYTSDGVRWDEIRPASYDPKARLAEMELDMIQAQVLYPSLAPQPESFGTDRERPSGGDADRARDRCRRHARRVAADRGAGRPRLRHQRLPERRPGAHGRRRPLLVGGRRVG